MKTIYLLSGPINDEFDKEIKKHLKKDLKGLKSITFIASTPDKSSKTDSYVYGNNDNIKGLLYALKDISNFTKVTVLDNRINSGKDIILNSDVIYLMGGDPITQNKYLRDNDYDKVLKNYKGIILGTSAGAMNMATKAYYSKDDDYDKSFFFDGIGIVNITIDPHFNINNKEQVKEAKKNSKINKIYGLPNQSAIRICKSITYIGKCYIFNNGELEEIN